MFKKQKLILDENKKVLEDIQREKEELLEIKRMLEDSSEKVNITNVFLFERRGYYNIVELRSEKISGTTSLSKGRVVEGYHSELIDIFSGVIVYEKSNVSPIQREEFISDRYGDCYKGYLYPITMADKSLLKYLDNMVPKIELQRLFYKLNNVELTTNTKTLMRDK